MSTKKIWVTVALLVIVIAGLIAAYFAFFSPTKGVLCDETVAVEECGQ